MKVGLLFLLVFTPLAFGTVEPWSIAIMEIVVFGLFFTQVGTLGAQLPRSGSARAILILFLLFVGLVLFQLWPLPGATLERVSPAAYETWTRFGGAAPGDLRTVSLYPDATLQELLRLLACAAVFTVVARGFRTRERILFLVKTILFMAALLAVVAIAQKLTWNGRILWVFPVEEYLRRDPRIWGPYVNHNHFAFYLEMALPLALGMLVYTAPATSVSSGLPWGRRLARFLGSESLASYAGYFLLALLLAACLLATLSRGAILASAVAGLFFAWNTWGRRSLRKKGLQATMAAAAAIGLIVLLPSWDRVVQRFEDIDEKQQVDRLYVLQDSLAMVKDYPLFGTGLGTFDQGYRRYQTKKSRLFYDHAHNDYLELATETGAAGFLLAGGMSAVFFVTLMRGWRKKKGRFGTCIGAGGMSSCAALAVHSGADFNMHIPANALLFAVIAGLTYAAIYNPSGNGGSHDSPGVAPRFGTPKRVLLGLGVLPLAGLAVYLPARDLIADHYYRQVPRILDNTATEQLDVKPIADTTMPSYLEAAGTLNRAAALAPARSAYPKAQADLHATLGEWATSMESMKAPLPPGALSGAEAYLLAVAEAKRAVSLEPTNPEYHLALGRYYASADGNLGRADEQIRRALAAYPVNAPLRYAAATLYLLYGGRAQALEQARELADRDDSYLIPESAEKARMIERRAPWYLARLKASYLFKALEITWKATGDISLVKSIPPSKDDAKAVLDYFLEWKGIEG